MTKPTGECYRDAIRFVKRQPDSILIHGTVYSDNRRVKHAWVETDTGWIWEPQTDKFYTKIGFEDTASPIEEKRYTLEEVAILMLKTGHTGPWEEDNLSTNPHTNPHVYSDIVVLTPDEYTNPRWGEIATKKYAYALGWTEKVTGDITWQNPRNRKEYIRFKLASRSSTIPRTIIVYNSKTGALREEIIVVKET